MATIERPDRREDGWPTRSDIQFDTDAERLCRITLKLVEAMGASESLTKAVMALDAARNHIADHVEGKPAAVTEHPTEYGDVCDWCKHLPQCDGSRPECMSPAGHPTDEPPTTDEQRMAGWEAASHVTSPRPAVFGPAGQVVPQQPTCPTDHCTTTLDGDSCDDCPLDAATRDYDAESYEFICRRDDLSPGLVGQDTTGEKQQ